MFALYFMFLSPLAAAGIRLEVQVSFVELGDGAFVITHTNPHVSLVRF